MQRRGSIRKSIFRFENGLVALKKQKVNTASEEDDVFVLTHTYISKLGEGACGLAEPWKINSTGALVVSKTAHRGDEQDADGLPLRIRHDNFLGPCRSDLEREGETMRKLHGGHFVRPLNYYHSLSNNQQKARLVVEFCDLGDLQGLFEAIELEGLTVPEPMIWYLLKSIVDGLAVMHFCKFKKVNNKPKWDHDEQDTASGIVHCDIRYPGNLFLVRNPDPESVLSILKIADFGNARPLEANEKDKSNRAIDVADTGAVIFRAMQINQTLNRGLMPKDQLDMWASGVKFSQRLVDVVKEMHGSWDWLGGGECKKDSREYASDIKAYMEEEKVSERLWGFLAAMVCSWSAKTRTVSRET
ncbi:hypothetical protein K402DRAFT_458425 [Aulographum hederae CBS 113979]|uniref:non-specific serine/threonine protein kinase n=1 Tax=Aulographum hederae CBS 113979 TaxID=1176131 RepID=A0A6G1GIY5_9PEZI|nr:hypothetical protein K402DRAFT_458425 [Aulographum hederae CBS 113979]